MIIDTDVGYDDLLAILFLLAVDADITAFTVVDGICHVPDGASALLRMQELLNRQSMIPVYMGSQAGQPNAFPDVWRNQANNLGWGPPDPSHTPQSLDAPAFLTQQMLNGPVNLLAIGPMTNIAPATSNCPGGKLSMTAMCGAFGVPGNLPVNAPVAEANLYVDPPSAAKVLSTYYGLPSTAPALVVPLDACEKVPINAAFLSAFQSAMGSSAFAKLAWQILQQINTEFIANGEPYYAFDPLAAAILQNPAIITNSSMVGIHIGPEGQSENLPFGPVAVAYTVDPQAFQSTFIQAFANH